MTCTTTTIDSILRSRGTIEHQIVQEISTPDVKATHARNCFLVFQEIFQKNYTSLYPAVASVYPEVLSERTTKLYLKNVPRILSVLICQKIVNAVADELKQRNLTPAFPIMPPVSLLEACVESDDDIGLSALFQDYRIDPNHVHDDVINFGGSLILTAIYSNSRKIIRLFQRLKFDFSKERTLYTPVAPQFYTPLTYAALLCDTEMVTFLIKEIHVDPNAPELPKQYFTPITIAAYRGDTEMVAHLQSLGASFPPPKEERKPESQSSQETKN